MHAAAQERGSVSDNCSMQVNPDNHTLHPTRRGPATMLWFAHTHPSFFLQTLKWQELQWYGMNVHLPAPLMPPSLALHIVCVKSCSSMASTCPALHHSSPPPFPAHRAWQELQRCDSDHLLIDWLSAAGPDAHSPGALGPQRSPPHQESSGASFQEPSAEVPASSEQRIPVTGCIAHSASTAVFQCFWGTAPTAVKVRNRSTGVGFMSVVSDHIALCMGSNSKHMLMHVGWTNNACP